MTGGDISFKQEFKLWPWVSHRLIVNAARILCADSTPIRPRRLAGTGHCGTKVSTTGDQSCPSSEAADKHKCRPGREEDRPKASCIPAQVVRPKSWTTSRSCFWCCIARRLCKAFGSVVWTHGFPAQCAMLGAIFRYLPSRTRQSLSMSNEIVWSGRGSRLDLVAAVSTYCKIT